MRDWGNMYGKSVEKKIKPLKAWSYSALSGFESCGFQHYCRKLLKLDEPKAPAMYRGIKIHNEAAAFLDRTEKMFPSSCNGFIDQFYELRDMNPIVEQKWAFTKKWRPTGWMSKDVKCRVIMDAGLIYSDDTADVIDHKTGKRYDDDYTDQLGLFSAALIKLHPYVKSVTARLWYLDSGDEVTMEFSKAHAMDVLGDLEERAEVMMSDTNYVPRPSWKCKFCHFRKDNGGPCKFGG